MSGKKKKKNQKKKIKSCINGRYIMNESLLMDHLVWKLMDGDKNEGLLTWENWKTWMNGKPPSTETANVG